MKNEKEDFSLAIFILTTFVVVLVVTNLLINNITVSARVIVKEPSKLTLIKNKIIYELGDQLDGCRERLRKCEEQ